LPAALHWKASPGSGGWNAAGNRTPSAVPNDPTDTATFVTELNGIVFNAVASAFIGRSLTALFFRWRQLGLKLAGDWSALFRSAPLAIATTEMRYCD